MAERVLIVLSPDGYAEVYGPRDLRVHVAHRLAVEQPEEVLADEYLDATLPPKFRELYLPVNLRAAGQCRRVTASDALLARWTVDLLRAAMHVGKAAAKCQKEKVA